MIADNKYQIKIYWQRICHMWMKSDCKKKEDATEREDV